MARVVEKCSAVVSSLTNKGGECGCAATIDAIEEIKLQKGRIPLRFGRRCAVVGSSGVLLDNATGPAIDAADQVIRCNYAPVKGYERHVGSKTTVRVSGAKNVYKIFSGKNKEVWAFEDAMREALVVPSNGERIFYSHQPLCREIRKLVRDGREHVTVRNRATNRSFVAAYSPAYDAFLELLQPCIDARPLKTMVFCNDTGAALARRKKQGYYHGWYGDKRASLSTGMHAITLALTSCDHVDVYGFGLCNATASCGPYCRYYDDELGGSSCGRPLTHAWHVENEFLTFLQACGLISLH